ncbi:GNAT family N-acetyltransferase [Stenotrophomonas maltophilia]|uniref:GNAT family N-acetyltransferase n=1 Tax=Stenotrophomonas TaxID=40323 RepID=UPI000621DABA|nr:MULTISPECIES: GNAT family N-acetyltransferase [unclassified Stenotrophomonas]KKF88928.1 ATP synthase subunit alpha [Stenotrophomonas maltophilia]MBA0255874.1 GNAT family N-acetyltransferase [Stenotrophomonas maltophilia]MBA0453275.1 GNAT family N-acetyltransferase [Stenotrophomonas maltophilia]MBA0480540.1 GNAT family N-acetyltransferase [Stenotrophomonas maltophilia]MBA0489510.1 GNAT family N-acetyltransferase [Stenotrophomonas maltophilia]
MEMTSRASSTALEPAALLEGFLAHPPLGFEAGLLPSGLPTFRAPLDLTTTMDDDLRGKLLGLPLSRLWRPWITWKTRFVGATSTEYTPLPAHVAPEALAEDVTRHAIGDSRLLVVKDLAIDSPLLDDAANAHSSAFLQALLARGFVELEGMPLAWVAIDFDSIDGYLGRLSSSRRKNIRRKLRSRDGLQIDCIATGDPALADPQLQAELYALYLGVFAQSAVHFDQLDLPYFQHLLADSQGQGRMFLYRHQGLLIGWNLCYIHAGKLVDKYIGLAYPQSREHNLYAVSWMHNLEYALQHGLSHYVAGWTDSRIKAELGARFTSTRHAIHARSPLLRAALRKLAPYLQGEPDGGG